MALPSEGGGLHVRQAKTFWRRGPRVLVHTSMLWRLLADEMASECVREAGAVDEGEGAYVWKGFAGVGFENLLFT